MQSNSISYLFWAEERRVDQLSIIWNQRHSVKGQVVMAVLRERKHIYKEVPFYYFIESKQEIIEMTLDDQYICFLISRSVATLVCTGRITATSSIRIPKSLSL